MQVNGVWFSKTMSAVTLPIDSTLYYILFGQSTCKEQVNIVTNVAQQNKQYISMMI